jgi:hypothetical protein
VEAAVSDPRNSAPFSQGHALEKYALSEEIMTMIHLLRCQALPLGDIWKVRSCHSELCIDVEVGASPAEWRRCLGLLADARAAWATRKSQE